MSVDLTKVARPSLRPKDISNELYREYVVVRGGNLAPLVYRINSPQALVVGETSHRVVDASGEVHLVPFPMAGEHTVVIRWKRGKDARYAVEF